MFKDTPAFASFSTDDTEKAKAFYGGTLGLVVTEEMEGNLGVTLGGGGRLFIYPKPDHQPATFTVLNFMVPEVGKAVDQLTAAGVRMERYEGFEQDERGISRGMGPAIAWFKDPAGNTIAVIEQP